MPSDPKPDPACTDLRADTIAPLPSPVPSPCVSLCKMNPFNRLCEGCLRSIDEIVQWGQASDDFKRAVWRDIKLREQQVDFD